jgi:hypothetical protein
MISHQKTKIKSLGDSLAKLHNEYNEARNLLDDQMQAVIYNDLIWLNSLIDNQVTKYEEIQKTEELFRKTLIELFQYYYPEATHPSLTKLLDAIEEPTEDLDKLRRELYDQIEKTEKLRLSLMDLLDFARNHNTETITALSQIAQQIYQNYNAEGNMNAAEMSSLGLNQKA